MPVEIAVRVVVDHAAGGAHQVHAEDEDQQVLQAGLALTGYPQGPERGPQQQIDADGLVQPGQLDEVHGAGMQAVQRLQQSQVHRRLSLYDLLRVGTTALRTASGLLIYSS
ncbi:hypothetical protein D9M71_567480 [compost metagenome]